MKILITNNLSSQPNIKVNNHNLRKCGPETRIMSERTDKVSYCTKKSLLEPNRQTDGQKNYRIDDY